MDVAAKLAVAEREGEHDAEESRTALRAAHDAAVRRLAEHGPTPEPSRDVRDAEAVTKARAADVDLLHEASRRSQARIEQTFLDASPDLARQLVAGLRTVLEAARDSGDAALLAGAHVDYTNPDAVHELPAELAAAFHRLAPLARRHDATRAAALALWNDLHLAGRPDSSARRRLADELDTAASTRGPRRDATGEWIAAFALAGYLTGPAPRFAGNADRRYATRWALVGAIEHPVARLVRAAILPADPIAPDDDEPAVVIRPGARTPVAHGPGLLGR
jgi:hypothetical protein